MSTMRSNPPKIIKYNHLIANPNSDKPLPQCAEKRDLSRLGYQEYTCRNLL